MNIAKHSFRAFCSVARAKTSSTAIPITISSPKNPRPSPQDVTSHHPKSGTKEFTNPWPSFQRSGNFFTFLKACFFSNDLKHPVVPENVRELIGTLNPSWETGNKNNIKAVWLGHACFYIELPCQPEQERGLRILFDPSLSVRCSPFSFAGPERITAAPISVDKLPELDLICFSHNHYDHLDIATLKALNQRYGDSVHYFVPLALSPFFNNLQIQNVTELDWWEEKIIKKNDWEARLGFLPAQHFTGRTLWDSAHTLWGSFSIESTTHPEKNIWFAGDTGRRSIPKDLEMRLPESKAEIDKLPVCPAHKQIGDLRGPFAFGMIPIGAYKPRFFMSPVHVDPEEAIELYKETRVKTAAAMHWGAWVLSSEETLEPKNELEKLCKEQGINDFHTWKIGERREI